MSMRVSVIVLTTACGAAAAQTSLLPLGPQSLPFGVSDAGATVVGRAPVGSSDDLYEASRWMSGNPVPQRLGFIPGTNDSIAFATSGDGGVIVGASGEQTYAYGFAFRYSGGQMQNLGLLGGATEYSMANNVSRDGRVIVGEGDTPFFYTMAWRKVGDGPLQEIGPFPGGSECWALDVSGNGSVVTGSGFDAADYLRAFRWTPETGMVALPVPNGAMETQAFGISSDGQHIAGSAYLWDGREVPCIWNGDAPVLLPIAPTHDGGVLYAVSDGGAVAVGNLWVDQLFPEAMIWTPTFGTRLLLDHLTAGGATIPAGWTLTHAWDISPDGRVIVGAAIDAEGQPQGFIATLYGPPIGSGCSTADFDNDGDSGTDADIEAFFACLSGNCCQTCWHLGPDFDGDGDSGTDADIEAFFRVLSGGNC
jgi:hypothetical protein